MKKIVLFIGLLTLFSCGKTEEQKQEEAISQALTQSTSGACGIKVVSDYNSVALASQSVYSNSDIYNAQDLARKFLNKYPGVNCVATTGYGLTEKNITINTHSFDKLLAL
jgi:hypothetical protein